MTTSIQKVNDSFILALPANIVERMRMDDNEMLHIYEDNGRIIIQKPALPNIDNPPNHKTIEELFEGYEGEYEPIEIDWGEPVGKEIW
ncbi:MAG: hypothetical protein FWB71_00320 [Defluviitaleaceae bacterium]|nr:hypothetical protein [Defluviitaleaceae bacterium]